MNTSPTLVEDLIRLVVEVTWSLESCDDSEVDDDDAVRHMESIAHALCKQSKEDRLAITAVVAEMAAQETRPELREFLEGFTENLGLNDQDDD